VKHAALSFAGFVVATALAGPAAAYVRYTSNSGKMFKWPQSCVELVAYPDDLEPMMTSEETMAALQASAAVWSMVSNSCTYLDISITSSTGKAPRAANDSHNNVIFRSTKWCKLMDNGECDPDVFYEPAALALTSVSASTASGTIRDADLEVNSFHFDWADLVAHPELRGTLYHDLQNAVTHELGHVIGLDHTCYLQPPPLIDNTGQPTPDCTNAPPAVLETTMFPSANPGDIDKRTLAPDDQQAVCDIYPAAADPMMCVPTAPPDEGCGSCATAGAPAPAAGLLLAIAGALLALRPRRRDRR
jgi:MYXO-CTERM domain-containing protein